MIDINTSKRITSLRYLLAILVVFIHNNIVDMAENMPGLVYNAGVCEFVQQNIYLLFACSAVPLFFLFAAYLQAKKSDSYLVLVKKRVKTVLVPYILWIGLYLLYLLAGKKLLLTVCPSLIADPDSIISCAAWSVSDWCKYIIGYSAETAGTPLAAPQLWFLRDLFVFVVLSPLFIFLIKKIPVVFFIILCLFCSSVNVPFNPKLNYSLFFYICGLYWGIYDIDLFSKLDAIKWRDLGILVVFYFCSYQFFSFIATGIVVVQTLISSLILLKVSGLIVKNEKIYAYSEYLSHFSFFIYTIHMPVLMVIIQKIWFKIIPLTNTVTCLLEYFCVTFIVVIVGTLLGMFIRRFINPLFALLCGGRK